MNTAGTIDRPLTHDPKKQAPMKPSTSEPTGSMIEDITTTGATDSRQNRTREMQLIPEALARAHMHDRLRDAQQERRALSVAAARRMQRRAERASLRARRALALAVMQ
ncbi:hypothetical protein [Streptomyces sp. enrichment culture]|uniref:hypothetical protein n=1 Tax=Streptomyces sp. enrichment culture TaxID=1795815 RepID=UPI003F5491FD